MPEDTTTHLSMEGKVLCEAKELLGLLPNAWPRGHRWVHIDQIQHCTCAECKKIGEELIKSGRGVHVETGAHVIDED